MQTQSPAPSSIQQLQWARIEYRRIEPRDLFYRVASDLLERSWRGNSELSLGEALAVLLFTWNRAYYQYHPASPDHVSNLEKVIESNRPELARLRSRSLASFADTDKLAVERLFNSFEALLGPVGAAKALHLLAPHFFVIWDRTIAHRYGCSLETAHKSERYIRFMLCLADVSRRLATKGDCPDDVVKAIDEWNFVTLTKQVTVPRTVG